MSLLEANFNELLEKIKSGREFGHASFEPIFYLVFPPEQILKVKHDMSKWWLARLKKEGWKVHIFSIALEVNSILQGAPLRKIWLAADSKAPLHWQKTNKALENAITNGSLQNRLESLLESLEGDSRNILLITDIEALHPYMRIGTIEGQLQGKFSVPTIFFYPGIRTGKTGLKFLGFYPEDGNYRSVHVGG
jgi:hypothetical protein